MTAAAGVLLQQQTPAVGVAVGDGSRARRIVGPTLEGHAPKNALQAFMPTREVTADRDRYSALSTAHESQLKVERAAQEQLAKPAYAPALSPGRGGASTSGTRRPCTRSNDATTPAGATACRWRSAWPANTAPPGRCASVGTRSTRTAARSRRRNRPKAPATRPRSTSVRRNSTGRSRRRCLNAPCGRSPPRRSLGPYGAASGCAQGRVAASTSDRCAGRGKTLRAGAGARCRCVGYRNRVRWRQPAAHGAASRRRAHAHRPRVPGREAS